MYERITSKESGFTLAEVLITLVITGVIATLTIPSLITNLQDAQYKTTLKKTFSDLIQAQKLILVDNVSFKRLMASNQNDNFRDLLLSKLSYIKKCDAGSIYGNCWSNIKDVGADGLDDNSAAILTNGSFLTFDYDDSTCSEEYDSSSCGYITIDVNGIKKPNQVGKDIFGIWIFEKTLKPFGSQNDGQSCTSEDNYAGCAAPYLLN